MFYLEKCMTSTKINFLARRASAMSLATLVLVSGSMANAQDAYWYGGFNAGKTEADLETGHIPPRLLQDGFTTTSIDGDGKDFGFKVFTGYRFSEYFAVEGSYFDLGKFGFRAAMEPSSNLAGNIRPMGFGLDLVGFLPLSDASSLFARAGVNYAEVRESFSARNLASHPYAKTDNDDANYKYGVGFQHDFNDKIAIRLEAERYRVEETIGLIDDVDMYSLGIVYRFGTRQVAAVTPAVAPVVATVAPQSQPPVPAPAPASAPTRITLSADSMFGFDSATLNPAGRAELDQLATDLRNVNYDVITVTGHSDRIGARQYNLDLSQRRAQTVRDYLVSAANIAAARITVRGVNGDQPITRPDQCLNLARSALITCLQPDRRVEVEVVGTR
jgi:OmpA-OmpF porin, OOP family